MKQIIKYSILLLLLIADNSNSQWVQCYGIYKGVVHSFAGSGNNIFAANDSNGVFLSTTNGLNWIQTSLNNQSAWSLTSNDNNIFAGTYNHGVFLSEDNGLNWTQTTLNSQYVYSLAISEINVIAGTQSGIYLSTNNGQNWTHIDINWLNALSLAAIGNSIFAGTYGAGVYISTNNGLNWTQTSLNNRFVYSLAISGNYIIAGTENYGIYRSSNNGLSWAQSPMNDQTVWALAATGNYVFAGTNGNGVFLSTNGGWNWIQRNQGLPLFTSIKSFFINNNYILAGTWASNVWRRYIPELIGVEKISGKVPDKLELFQNYPNPFNPTTKIRFSIPDSSPPFTKGGQRGLTTLKIYDVLGREIAILLNENLKFGTYEVEWSATGRNSNFASGVYFYKLSVSDFENTKKMVLIK